MHRMGMRRLALLVLNLLVAIACHLGPSSPAASVASGNDVASMKRMLDAGLNPNAHDSAGYTPLIAASRAGNAAMIRLLTSRGADPNLRDTAVNSWTPLLHAIHKSQPAAIAALLDAGANPNGTDTSGTTPLMMAAGYGYADIVKMLLAHNANPRIATNDGITALDLARSGVPDIDRFTVFDCQTDTVKALLAADPKLPDHTDKLPGIARLLMRTQRCGA
jgi:ankyrin repeat protein